VSQRRPGDVVPGQPVDPEPTPGQDVSDPTIDRLLADDGVASTGTGAGPDPAPSTEADPVDGEDVWVHVTHAADVVGRSEGWLRAECQAGHLRCRRDPHGGPDDLLVSMAAVRDLAGRA
jgi:hypothetical protein